MDQTDEMKFYSDGVDNNKKKFDDIKTTTTTTNNQREEDRTEEILSSTIAESEMPEFHSTTSATIFGPASYHKDLTVDHINITATNKSVNYTSFVRFCMYVFFVFYLVSVRLS